ncbi:MAG TPA: 3-oxoacyl-[acyl-carrier-protein] synthase III C-terminal domain-containing protein, partial [Micromonosporaceae bacterium]|nr:3-oxoacyl-[acyl-carrier-protein] synthase III C-terminal domain-containing protein [Micromonosporaceae bacterium]
LSDAGVREGIGHTTRAMAHAGLSIADIDRIIPHQTSLLTIRSVIRRLNQAFGTRAFGDANVINNLAERGNTSTTTHIVALHDASRDGRISSGQRLMFGIAGSGINVGNAFYALDDLPGRIVTGAVSPRPAPPRPRLRRQIPVRIAGLGIAWPDGSAPTTLGLIGRATAQCLDEASIPASTVDTLIHAGLYRSGMIAEPAIAAITAGELGFDGTTSAGGSVLGFDLTNGGLGLLDACRIACALIEAGRSMAALVVASEVEERAPDDPEAPVAAMGSALLLRADPQQVHGFLGFHGHRCDDLVDAFAAWATHDPGAYYIRSTERSVLAEAVLEHLPAVVAELCQALEVDPAAIRAVIPPSVARDLAERLRHRWPALARCIVELPWPAGDLFTSSIPAGLAVLRADCRTAAGDLVLLTSIASGGQVGAALYRL